MKATSSGTLRMFGLRSVLAAIAIGIAVGGCTREDEKSEVAERMNDPVYRQQLSAIDKEQRGIMKKVHEARMALQAAKDAGADEETLAKLQADVDASLAELDQSHKKAQAAVRAKINDALKKDAQKASGR